MEDGRLKALVSVVDFGAKGNGVDDDTAAIQNAIDTVTDLYFPPGSYPCDQLTMRKGTHLRGANSGCYVWNGTTFAQDFDDTQRSRIVRRNGADSDLIVGPLTARRVIIEDLELDGNNANQTSSTAEIINILPDPVPNDTHWILNRCYIHGWNDYSAKGSGGNNITVGENRQAVHINESIINYAGAHGIDAKGSDFNIVGCIIGDNNWENLILGAWVCYVAGCAIYNAGQSGIYVGNNVKRIMIIGNGIDRNMHHGINVSPGSTGVSIVGNQFTTNSRAADNTFAHVNVGTTTGHVNIIGCTFSSLEPGYTDQTNYAINLVAGATAYEAGNNYEGGSVGGYCNASESLYVTTLPSFYGATPMWQSDATAAVAEQGVALPDALTELDATFGGTRRTLSSQEIGREVQVTVRMRETTYSGGANTLMVSVRDTSNTANILASVTLAIGAVDNYDAVGTWTAKPSWFQGNKTFAVYTSGGGRDDYVFRDVTLRWRR